MDEDSQGLKYGFTLRLLLRLWAFLGKVWALGAKVWAFTMGVREP